MCCLVCHPKSSEVKSVCVCVWGGRCGARTPARVAVTVSDYFLRRIVVYMTLHFHCHFEVPPPPQSFFFFFSSSPNVRVRVYVCVCARKCVGMYYSLLYLFSAMLRALCLQGLTTVAAQAS